MNLNSPAARLAAQALKLQAARSYPEAESLYAQALELEPSNPVILLAAGALQIDSGHYELGLSRLLAAQSAGASGSALHHAMAVAFNALQRYDEAEIAARKCIEARQDWPPAWLQLAFALCGQERYEEAALVFYEVALETGTPEAYYLRAVALYAANRPEESLSALEDALERRPDRALLYVGPSAALDGVKRSEEALLAHRAASQRARQSPFSENP